MRIDPNWSAVYFEEPYGEAYAEYLLPSDVAREEAQFACDVLQLEPGDRLLDCPCGFGRHLQFFAALFPDAVGLDRSADCLARARRDFVAGENLVRGDMLAMPFPGASFDAAVNLFNSFGYFGEAGNQRLLAEYARVLRPEGRLLLDMANRIPLLDIVAEQRRTEVQIGELRLLETWRYDPAACRIENRTTFLLEDEATERSYSVRLFALEEIDARLEAAGLHVADVWGDFDGSAYDAEESTRMIVAARRGDA